MKKDAREALKAGRKVAQLVGVIRADGTELGRFTLSESPRVRDASRNRGRQAVQRLLRERA